MDDLHVFRLVSERLKELGISLQPLPTEEFAAAWKQAGEIIGEKDPKRPGDVCEHLVLLPFYLAVRYQEATGKNAYLFGYEVDCPSIRMRFRVLARTGDILRVHYSLPDAADVSVTL
jgi:hypothetical protein